MLICLAAARLAESQLATTLLLCLCASHDSTPTAGEGAVGAVVIRFYRNGFTVGDGDLRRLDDPANREFLEDMNRG